MSTTINTNFNFNATDLINAMNQSVSGTESATKVEGATLTKAADGTLSVQLAVAGTDQTVSVELPSLEVPSLVDSTTLAAALTKVSTTAVTFTDEQVQAFAEELLQQLGLVDTSASTESTSSSSTFFNLYQLMALMQEVAQQQRDSARDLRKAANEQALNSIQAQADKQRAAAIVGAVIGAVMCTVQVVSAFVSLKQQASAFKSQFSEYSESGLGATQAKLSKLEAQVNPEKTQATLNAQGSKLDSIYGGDTNVRTNIDNEVNNIQSQAEGAELIRSAQTKVTEAQDALDIAKAQVGADRGSNYTETIRNAETDLAKAKAELSYTEAAVANKTANTQEWFSEELTSLKTRVQELSNSLESSEAFRTGREAIETARMRHEIFSAVAGLGQSLGSGVSEAISAEATEEQATQKSAEYQADQMKEIFDQGQNVLDAAVQLLQAVLQAEVQSMRDAIQA